MELVVELVAVVAVEGAVYAEETYKRRLGKYSPEDNKHYYNIFLTKDNKLD